MFPLKNVPSADLFAAEGTHHHTYAFADLLIGVSCHEPEQALALDDLWRQLFALERNESSSERLSVHFSFKAPGSVLEIPRGEVVCQSASLQIYMTQEGFFLKCGMSCLELDISLGLGTGILDEDFWSQSIYDQREFFLLSLLMLLRPHGLYGLHANALANDGKGYLIVGRSGSGKTTLTLSLIRKGWDYLSDDAVVLKAQGTIEALAFRRGSSCTHETIRHFPELSSCGLESFDAPYGKHLLDLESLFPGRFRSRCESKIILFPEIIGQPRSRLLPIDKVSALISLMQQSAGIMTDRIISKRQLKVLKQLVQQAHSYTLLLGTDVYHEPEVVSELLTGAGEDAYG